MSSEAVGQCVHDIRNKFNRISMQTELLKLLVEQGSDKEKIVESLDIILAACEESAGSLDVLAKYSK